MMRALLDNLTPLMLQNVKHSIRSDVNWLMLSNGAADLNDNVIYFGFEGDHSEPSYVAKIPRLPSNAWVVQKEYNSLVEIWKCLGADADRYVPEPVACFQINGQQALVISFVRGEGLLYSAKKKLWLDPDRVLELSREVARGLRTMHDKIARPCKDEEQEISDFRKKTEIFTHLYAPSKTEQKALFDLVRRLKEGNGYQSTMIQGDFWHGNIIRSSIYNTLIFVDWQHSRWLRDVSLDVYMFLLAGALAGLQGSAQDRARTAVGTLKQWRSKVIPAYLTAYGTVEQFSLLPARYGMLLCCVEKAVRAKMDFGYHQSDDLIWRNLFTELVNIPNDGFFNGI